MKMFTKIVAWIVILASIVFLVKFISDSTEDSQTGRASWGIVKDSPIK